MFQFENIKVLYGLFFIPIMIAIYIYLRYRYSKHMNDYGEKHLLEKLMADTSVFMQHLKFIIFCFAWCFLILALANPQKGTGISKEKRKGIEIMFCLDISNSMLAQDYVPNRIEAAKRSLLSFVDKLQGDKIGIVIFAGKSFVQLPITSDYAAAKMFISNISTTQINTQGTDIAGAIDIAAASMLPSGMSGNILSSQSKKVNKVIVVVSDGENHFEDAIEVASQVAQQGIRVFTLGVGSLQGEPIPIRTQNGVDYKKDRDGNTVITRLNENMLKGIAQAGNGTYIYANNAYLGFDELQNQLSKIEKSELEEVSFATYESKFYIPLWIAFILMIIELFLFNRKLFNFNLLNKIKGNSTLNAVVIIFFCIFCFSAKAQTREELQDMRTGNRQYKQAEKLNQEVQKMQQQQRQSNQNLIENKTKEAQNLFNQSNTNYIKANTSTGNYYKSLFNQGDVLYRQGKYKEAEEKFSSVANNSQLDNQTKAKAYHNLGNSLLKQQKYQESIDAYKQALKVNPKDMDTKYNMEYAKKMLLMQQQQQNDNKKDNQDQQNNQQNNQQQNQNQNQDKQQNQNENNKNDENKDENNKNDDQKQQSENQADRQKREAAKRQLDALQQNEKNTQEKVKLKENQHGKPVKQEKDW